MFLTSKFTSGLTVFYQVMCSLRNKHNKPKRSVMSNLDYKINIVIFYPPMKKIERST